MAIKTIHGDLINGEIYGHEDNPERPNNGLNQKFKGEEMLRCRNEDDQERTVKLKVKKILCWFTKSVAKKIPLISDAKKTSLNKEDMIICIDLYFVLTFKEDQR